MAASVDLDAAAAADEQVAPETVPEEAVNAQVPLDALDRVSLEIHYYKVIWFYNAYPLCQLSG